MTFIASHYAVDSKIRETFPSSGIAVDAVAMKEKGMVHADVRGVGVVLSNLVELFFHSTHQLYLDACTSVDGWIVMIGCFLDANRHIQPLGFYLASSERDDSWRLFLSLFEKAGLRDDTVADLVVVSDQCKGLETAVDAAFPHCEHVPCAVHLERHIQGEWMDVYGKFSLKNLHTVEVFNSVMEYFRKACIATTEAECHKWLKKAKAIEIAFASRHSGDEVRMNEGFDS